MERLRFKDYLKDYLEYYHITNKEFAERLGITPKHLIDILSGKQNLSFELIQKISTITNISVEYILRMEADYFLEKDILNYLEVHNMTITEFLNKFSYKYLIKSKYIDFTDTTDKLDIVKDILKFLRVATIEQIQTLDKEAFYKSKNGKPELLLLWLEKCYRKMLVQKVSDYKKENIMALVNYIRECALKNEFNEEKLIKKFNENGICLVIEDDIKGSKIRGAFKVHKNIPAIYLTHKHRRIADVYFALLHEMAHLKSDFNSAKSKNYVSYESEKEIKADMIAYNFMVDKEYYDNVCLNKHYDIEKENRYPKSFIVYLLAKDKKIPYKSKIYQKYNILL